MINNLINENITGKRKGELIQIDIMQGENTKTD